MCMVAFQLQHALPHNLTLIVEAPPRCHPTSKGSLSSSSTDSATRSFSFVSGPQLNVDKGQGFRALSVVCSGTA